MDHQTQARQIIEDAFGGNRPDVIDDIVAVDCIENQRGLRPGRGGVKDTIATLHRWFSDFSLTVEAMAIDGDTVWCRNRARGVNTGSVMGFPPTGRPFETDVLDIMRFEDGLMVEHWGVADQLGLLIQLGLLERPARPAEGPDLATTQAGAGGSQA
jgi:predicted ester cyclase